MEIALSNARSFAGDGWNNIAPRVSGFQREATERFSSFKQKQFLDKGVSLCNDVKSIMPVKSIRERLGRFRLPFFHPGKGMLGDATFFNRDKLFRSYFLCSNLMVMSYLHCKDLVLDIEHCLLWSCWYSMNLHPDVCWWIMVFGNITSIDVNLHRKVDIWRKRFIFSDMGTR